MAQLEEVSIDLYKNLVSERALTGETMLLNMGPQHPSTHGVLRFVIRADGEVMKEAIPDVGYLHRSIEKIAEKVGWHGFLPYTDRVDYVAAMFCNHGWARAAETLGGIEVPKRAEYCRVIADELCRIHSHLLGVVVARRPAPAEPPQWG